MRTYFVSRWGNPEDGPNGPDTNFLVWARTRDEAADLVDALLPEYPHINGPNVAPFCHLVIEMGATAVYGKAHPGVIHGPWVAHAILKGAEGIQLSWERTDPDSGWAGSPNDEEPMLPHSDPPGPPTEPPGPPDEEDDRLSRYR